MIEWKKIDIEEELIFDHYYRQLETRSCEYTFANNVLWSPYYDITYGIVEDMLVFLLCQENDSVSFPIGADNLKRAIEVLMQYFAEQNKEFRMHLVTSEQFEKLEAVEKRYDELTKMIADPEVISNQSECIIKTLISQE